MSLRLSSNKQIRTNINADWDWALSISTQKIYHSFARARDFRGLIAMRAHLCLAERHIFIHYAKFKTTKKCHKIALHRMVRFFFWFGGRTGWISAETMIIKLFQHQQRGFEHSAAGMIGSTERKHKLKERSGTAEEQEEEVPGRPYTNFREH